MKAIAIAFDGVIRQHPSGLPMPGAMAAVRALVADHLVFVFTGHDRYQVAEWLRGYDLDAVAEPSNAVRAFWTERGRLPVTNRKLAAAASMEDRAVRFRSWDQVLTELAELVEDNRG